MYPPFLTILFQKNDHPSSFSLASREFTGQSFERISPIPTCRVLMVTLQHFVMINITSHVRGSLYDKYMLFTHFYLMQGKK